MALGIEKRENAEHDLERQPFTKRPISQRQPINPVYVPAQGTDDWRRLLAEPAKQWKEGFSAMQVAESWQGANGFPVCIADTLQRAGEPFSLLKPLLILPEHQVPLPGGRAASHNDAWVLASHNLGLASITIEGKVKESFGPTLAEWLVDASPGKQERLAFLTGTLGLPSALPGTVRYQLLHRVASAIIEAKRFHANVALCLVQSFSPTNEGLADFQAFVALFGKQVQPGEIVALGQHEGIPFYASWVGCSPVTA